MPYSNLSSVFDATALTAINTQLTALQTALNPHSVNLTQDEIQGMYKMNEQRQSLGIRCIQISESNANLVPQYLNLAEAKKDLERFTNLYAVQTRLEGLLAGVRDGRIASGSEVMLFVKAMYKSIEAAAEQNVPGAKAFYDELSVYFDLPSQPDASATNV